jgi:succinyl-CoA synthetase beta subunit
MNLHEYQAKALFTQYNIPVSDGVVVESSSAVRAAWVRLGGGTMVAKVQVHAGGRGKAGGIAITDDVAEMETFVDRWVGQRLVTQQTGAAGRPVNQLLIEQSAQLLSEHYLALTIDRAQETPVFIACAEGGMAIEELAASRPTAILTIPQPITEDVSEATQTQIAAHLDMPTEARSTLCDVLNGMWALMRAEDASLIEINPLSVTDVGLRAIDAKLTIDDNALMRHDTLAALRDTTQDDAVEVEAQRVGITYIGLDGDIGCLVNGAGLAMATNDIILLHGGRPANFLDVGGGATVEQVTQAFALILQSGNVRAILVNIFGGIMQCDVIAEGIIAATQQTQLSVPLVARLEGTHVERGRQLLAESGLALTSASDLDEAAARVVALAKDGA